MTELGECGNLREVGKEIKNIKSSKNMKFEIDLSGTDLLKDKSVLAISDGKGLIKGFQINQKIIDELLTNWQKGKYFCRHSKRGLGFFKAMVYSSVICCLLESIDNLSEVELEICRDFMKTR